MIQTAHIMIRERKMAISAENIREWESYDPETRKAVCDIIKGAFSLQMVFEDQTPLPLPLFDAEETVLKILGD